MKDHAMIRIEIDPSCPKPEVVIRTGEKNELVEKIVSAVEQCLEAEQTKISAYQGNVLYLLEQQSILRVYTEPRKLMVCAESGLYEARCTLKDLESQLDARWFVRISRFEIINIHHVASFDFSVAGTISVTFEDGSTTWVARRYVRAIEKTLSQLPAGSNQQVSSEPLHQTEAEEAPQ